MTVRQLVPEALPTVDLDDRYGGPRPRVEGRPWVGICMIASLDGSTVVDGRSGGLSNPDDAAVLGALRRAADVVLVGAGTIRAEGYAPPKHLGVRIGVVTATGDVDVAGPLFTSGAGFVVMPEDGPRLPDGPGGPVEVLRAGTGRVDVARALAGLGRIVDDPAFVQVEGGPRLNASFIDAGLVDELNLTVSPRLVGGGGPRLTVGAESTLLGFELAHLLVDERSFLYTRWIRAAG